MLKVRISEKTLALGSSVNRGSPSERTNFRLLLIRPPTSLRIPRAISGVPRPFHLRSSSAKLEG